MAAGFIVTLHALALQAAIKKPLPKISILCVSSGGMPCAKTENGADWTVPGKGVGEKNDTWIDEPGATVAGSEFWAWAAGRRISNNTMETNCI